MPSVGTFNGFLDQFDVFYGGTLSVFDDPVEVFTNAAPALTQALDALSFAHRFAGRTR